MRRVFLLCLCLLLGTASIFAGPKKGGVFRGESIYLDMGVFYGTVVSEYMVWWPEPVHIDKAKLDNYLFEMFDNLNQDKFNNIIFAFAQLCDIDALLAGSGNGTPTDKITDIFRDNYPVGDTGQNFFEYLISYAHSKNVLATLAFGGVVATDTDWTIQGDATGQAQNLAHVVAKYSLDVLDFDIESSAIMSVNTTNEVTTFFTTLYGLVPHVTLTVPGDVNYWAGNVLNPLFEDLDAMFSGVNLMLYSNSQYYLDAVNPTWGITEWLVYTKLPSITHIGFFDRIAYNDPAASAGQRYDVEGLTRGSAAAQIYLDVAKALNLNINDFGNPFWWTDDPKSIITSEVFTDFAEYLNRKTTKKHRKREEE